MNPPEGVGSQSTHTLHPPSPVWTPAPPPEGVAVSLSAQENGQLLCYPAARSLLNCAIYTHERRGAGRRRRTRWLGMRCGKKDNFGNSKTMSSSTQNNRYIVPKSVSWDKGSRSAWNLRTTIGPNRMQACSSMNRSCDRCCVPRVYSRQMASGTPPQYLSLQSRS